MKKIIFIATLLMAMSSCSTYFYSVLETPNRDTECIENGDFLYQNDSLWIAYNFEGKNAPVKITVFNKLDIPLHIDWTKSALIIDNIAESYASKDKPFYGSGVRETVQTHTNRSVSYNEFAGVIEGSENISYIFPQTMVSKQFMNIHTDYGKIKNLEFEKIQLLDKKNRAREVRKINYSQNNTPFHFKSFLTMYYEPQKEMTFQTEFYLASLLKTSTLPPNNLPENMLDKGNIFYQIKTDNTGWYIVGTVAAVAVLTFPFMLDDPKMEHSGF